MKLKDIKVGMTIVDNERSDEPVVAVTELKIVTVMDVYDRVTGISLTNDAHIVKVLILHNIDKETE
jgi:hypothetical protein